MSHFLPLEITGIDRATRDAVVLSLQPQKGSESKFAFRPGQYLTFRTTLENIELRRSYSICSAVNESFLRVGIKRVDGGGFSTWANDTLQIGDTLEAMSPMGNFTSENFGEANQKYLAFSAGSGITPVLSIIKTILQNESQSEVILIYGNRNIASMMFREELEDLKNTYLERFSIHHILSCGSDVEFLSGRIDKAKCDQIFKTLVDVHKIKEFFICGPEPMTDMLRENLIGRGIAKEKIKYELFGTSQMGRLSTKELESRKDTASKQCELTIIQDGVSHKVDVSGSQTSVLQAALGAEIDAPFACQAGVCSTCRARVLDGEYEFVTNHALEDYEVEQGFVLTCQCYPNSERLVVEYEG